MAGQAPGAPSTGTARTTLATVAELAGVSVATVSKVLNGRHDVADDTRARVEVVLRQRAYVAPSRRRVEAEAGRTVELVFDHGLHAYTAEVVVGVLDAATDAGVTVTVRSGPDRRDAPVPDTPRTWVRRLVAAGRLGVVAITGELTTPYVTELDRSRVPVVVVDPLNAQLARLTSVGSTNFAGGFAAGEHLLGLGHRRIAFLGALPAAPCSVARLGGLKAALDRQGAPLAPALHVVETGFDYESGLAGGARLLDRPEPPTAVFATCDEIALGVVEAARRRGIRVPQELSVVGFDDSRLAAMASPPLTTVRQPLAEMGAVALRTLLRLTAGEVLDAPHVELSTRLVVRASTARPAGTVRRPPPTPADAGPR